MSETIHASESAQALRIYAAALASLAVVLSAAAAVDAGVGRLGVVVALAAVAYVAESRTIRISPRVDLSGSVIPLVMAAVLFGPAAAAVVGMAAMMSDRRGPVERFAIYAGGRALAGCAAGAAAFTVEAGVAVGGLGRLLFAAAAAATATTAIELAVAAVTLRMRHRTPLVETWRLARAHAVITIALCAPVAALFAYAYGGAGAWVLVFFVIPVAAARAAFGMHAPQEQLIAALEETNSELEFANSRLRRINMSFAEALVKAIDGRDAYTAGHSKAVAEYSRDIARELGLQAGDIDRIHLCGLVHDIGKIGVRSEVLEKQAALDEREWIEMRRHPEIGEAILLEVPGYDDMADVVRSHHERWDGAGYPDNLRGERIPKLARVLAVADSYNAMTSDRPYREAMTPEWAVKQLALGKGSQFEPESVDAFLRVLGRAPGWYRRGDFANPDTPHGRTDGQACPAVPVPRAAA